MEVVQVALLCLCCLLRKPLIEVTRVIALAGETVDQKRSPCQQGS